MVCLRRIRWHDLRHSVIHMSMRYAHLAPDAGAEVICQAWLNHSTIHRSMYCAHLAPDAELRS
jgi:integrase